MEPPKLKPALPSTKRRRSMGDKIVIGLASIAAVLLVILLVRETNPDSRFDDSEAIGKLTTPGTIRRRHARTLNWKELQGESPLFLRDIVYVPKDTFAEVSFGGNKKVRLEPDTMVQFDDITLDHIFITLFDGKAEGDVVVKYEKPPADLVATPTPPLPKPPAELAEAMPVSDDPVEQLVAESVRLQTKWANLQEEIGDEPKLDVLKPISGKETGPDPLEGAEIRLLFPQDAGYNLRANRWLTMEWSGLPQAGASYQLELSQNRNFARVLKHKTQKLAIRVQLEKASVYYWRVRGQFGVNEVLSPVGKFEMLKIGGLGNVRNQRKVTASESQFALDVATDRNFEQVLSTTPSTVRKCSTRGLAKGKYFCRVRSATELTVLGSYAFEVR